MLELNNSITLVVGLLNKNQTSLKKGNENVCLFLHKYFLNQDLSKLRKKNPKKLEFQKIFRIDYLSFLNKYCHNIIQFLFVKKKRLIMFKTCPNSGKKPDKILL
ncbi:hypothetical protein BpHYR1_035469 [Brachionus plicatilis]|uniref:Uncharacterized protein n=1 Tax=Brachionus plicatilis TaxID=10195 RepID=A0A3M7RCW1_BRAPC|nr:hypothetical protein BpHYR1_035469 [Brachionus plicatilis]